MCPGALLQFFSLSKLDTRLDAPTDLKKKQAIINKTTASRWNTLEFKFYLLVFIVIVPFMYKTAMDASNETNPNYPKFERLLSQGWLFGRKVDNSDAQYRFFRDNLIALGSLGAAHILSRKLVKFLIPSVTRTLFDFIFGMIFLFAVHGVSSIKVVLHISLLFGLARLTKNYYKLALATMWIYGVGSLFFNDNYRSYPLGNMLPFLSFIDTGFKGIVARWDVFYNFTLLKALSANLDFLKRYNDIKIRSDKKLSKDEERKPDSLPPTPNDVISSSIADERERMNASFDLAEYSYINYFAYISYAPLFICGPIVTYNDFRCQVHNKLPSINCKRTFIYGLRFLFCVLVMEFLLHFMYVVAVSKTGAWDGDTPFQISMIGLFNLNIIWLKLLIPWRLFRLWSLVDGIDPPENMIRCMDNNYSALSFWKAWHRSYNKWVVKYIYIPLGGASNRILASLFVFSFVAIWHDIELKLLLWGWTIVLFLLPEYFASTYFKQFSNQWWYRHLCAIGGVVNIWLMMIANLYGFCLGHKGTLALLNEMFGTVSGLIFFMIANVSLFVGVQVMFELRESEKRRGIDVKC